MEAQKYKRLRKVRVWVLGYNKQRREGVGVPRVRSRRSVAGDSHR